MYPTIQPTMIVDGDVLDRLDITNEEFYSREFFELVAEAAREHSVSKGRVSLLAKHAIYTYDRFPASDDVFVTSKSELMPLLLTLSEEESFGCSYLNDLFVIDNFGKEFRFVLVCRISNLFDKRSFIVICATEEGAPFPTITPLFSSAVWPEREAWELYGIYFHGHSGLRRLLTDYGFRGYPMRKDFPMSGYLECFYSYHLNLIEFVKIEFMQEYRKFEFYNNWVQDEDYDEERELQSEFYNENNAPDDTADSSDDEPSCSQ